mmetsp:Transcript_31440/g.91448  ORF Transcript_31440/g.91448 Transcript_31440/m.91448 type:complete len:219 (+) Transcript_31440:467-1123(+)
MSTPSKGGYAMKASSACGWRDLGSEMASSLRTKCAFPSTNGGSRHWMRASASRSWTKRTSRASGPSSRRDSPAGASACNEPKQRDHTDAAHEGYRAKVKVEKGVPLCSRTTMNTTRSTMRMISPGCRMRLSVWKTTKTGTMSTTTTAMMTAIGWSLAVHLPGDQFQAAQVAEGRGHHRRLEVSEGLHHRPALEGGTGKTTTMTYGMTRFGEGGRDGTG